MLSYILGYPPAFSNSSSVSSLCSMLLFVTYFVFKDESFTPVDVGVSLDVITVLGTFTPMIALPLPESSHSKFYITYSHEL